ncbi:MAG: leishmanolysin-related zinc metalloendopeptidase [Gemmatimonadaceae bacterium]
MPRHRSALVLLGTALLMSACKKDKVTGIAGPPASILAGAAVTAFAAQAVTTPIQVTVRDASGVGVSGETVTFNVTGGGGSLASTTAVSGANGVTVVPTWTFGKSDVPQSLRAALGALTATINGTVNSSYDITIKFFGPPMTGAQQALFTNAAARLQGIITGDLPPVQMNTTLTGCSEQVINEQVDDVVIYASIDDIDGPNGILASAGPCFIRQSSPHSPVVGVMFFDSADLASMQANGTLQDVITHEMLHVLGIGSLWDDGVPDEPGDVPLNNLLSGEGTNDPRYIGAQGRQACQAIGGSIACATSVPVENVGGVGSAGSHWRETTFVTELMTSRVDFGSMPLSRITIGALADLGYTVNTAPFDNYTVTNNNAVLAFTTPAASRPQWERKHPTTLRMVDTRGSVTATRVIR